MTLNTHLTEHADQTLIFLDRTDPTVVNVHLTLLSALASLGLRSGLACSIYMIFLGRMDNHYSLHITRQTLADLLGVSKTGISKATRILIDLGLVTTSRVSGLIVYQVIKYPNIELIQERLGIRAD